MNFPQQFVGLCTGGEPHPGLGTKYVYGFSKSYKADLTTIFDFSIAQDSTKPRP